ncbi:MAG: response regulator [Lachnospiraceae bacterium]|nr:response regulator [Lachnospiraceae bacterium]
MKNELSVLLVEDDQAACDEIIQYMDTLEDMTLIGVTNSVVTALEFIRDFLPDAMILDLELHSGYGNGITLLQEIQQMNLSRLPYVLVTTNNSSMITYDSARQFGADFILSKHQEDYSPQNAVDFLRMIKSVIQNRTNSTNKNQPSLEESPEKQNKRLVRKITLELNQIGINPKAVGYDYLIDAIQLTIQERTHNLSQIIGEKYGKTNASVERAMQTAISKAWRTTPIHDLLHYYTARINSEKGVPTITEFVYYYANKLKNEY